MNINGSVIRSLGLALTKNNYERKLVWISAKKTSLYAWKVKPLIVQSIKVQPDDNYKNFENEVF